MARPTLDDMLISIAKKMKSEREAFNEIGECFVCGCFQDPVDVAADLDGSRLWVTMCCEQVRMHKTQRPATV